MEHPRRQKYRGNTLLCCCLHTDQLQVRDQNHTRNSWSDAYRTWSTGNFLSTPATSTMCTRISPVSGERENASSKNEAFFASTQITFRHKIENMFSFCQPKDAERRKLAVDYTTNPDFHWRELGSPFSQRVLSFRPDLAGHPFMQYYRHTKT